MSNETERARLRRELAESRRHLSEDVSGLGHAMNVGERLQDSVRRHPALWIGGGLLGGLALSSMLRLPGRDQKSGAGGAAEQVKRSLFLGLLGIAGKQILRLSEPALKRYAEQEIERFLGASRSFSTPEKSPTPTQPDR